MTNKNKQQPIRRFWLRQNDEQEQATAMAGVLREKAASG
jgi:hypothetical protein